MGVVREIKSTKAAKHADPEIIAALDEMLKKAHAGEVDGLIVVYVNDNGWGYDAHLMAVDIWEALGFVEGSVKPTLIGIANG